ncbi:MAG: hypothetical protein JW814_06410 [Candidatus Krumholzibacteriota bacterium]|nr:hypothetical protein [Candidatus Krumholzibacteriota bacterium]
MKDRFVRAGAAAIFFCLCVSGVVSAGTALAEGLPAAEAESVKSPAPPGMGKITLITNGWVDIRDLLASIAASAGLGLEVAPDVAENVNVHLVDVAIEKALETVLGRAGLGYEIIDGVLIVYRGGMLTRSFFFDYPVTEREGRGALLVSGNSSQSENNTENESHVTSTAVMKVWPQVISAINILVFNNPENGGAVTGDSSTEALSIADEEGRILVINPMAGLVQVTAEWPRIKQVEELIENLEVSLQRQVAIEVKILEVLFWESDRTGIDWTTITGGDVNASLESAEGLASPVFSFIVGTERLSSLMEAISEQGNVEVLSTPRITTLNNQKAIVRIVTEEVFFVAQVEPALVSAGTGTNPVVEYRPEMIPVGMVLDVTPQIGNNGVITLNVHPTISNIVREEVSPNQDRAPVISIRELDTVGRVADGETLVIAGLLSEGERIESSGIPLLRSIPLLGYFFKRSYKEKTTTELVMMLTPVILSESGATAGDAGKGEEAQNE